MIKYATVGSNRIDEARDFYDGLMGQIGMHIGFDHPTGVASIVVPMAQCSACCGRTTRKTLRLATAP